MNKSNDKNIKWTTLAIMAFTTVWAFGNTMNGFIYAGGIKAIFTWIIIFALFFIPYVLMVGEAGSAFKESSGGVSDWIGNTGARKLAYYAGWTFWACHIPYLASKSSAGLKALSWSVFRNGEAYDNFSSAWIQLISLFIFIFFCWLTTKGIRSIKILVTVAGSSMIALSILFIIMMFAAPAINPNGGYINTDFSLQNFIPNINIGYFANIAVLIFAVGGCEKLSPYVNQIENPSKNFPKGIIAMTIIVSTSAILGTISLSMMFNPDDINNNFNGYVANGAYWAFQKLGMYYGLGDIFTIIYSLSTTINQFAVLALSIDAPLRMLLDNKSSQEFVPQVLLKKNKNGIYTNGLLLTGILGGLLILFQALESFISGGSADALAQFVKLNSVCMSLNYTWVFVAYFLIKKNIDKFNPQYKFVKSKTLGLIIAIWCAMVTVIFSIVGMYDENPINMVLNIMAPIVLSVLGLVFPIIAKRQRLKRT